MIKTLFVTVALLSLAATAPAHAFEHFIPMGTGYSTDVSSIPRLGSDAGQTSAQADVYESEVYHRALEAKKRDSYMMQWRSDRNFSGSSDFIDY